MIEAIKNAFNGLLEWFSMLPSRIVAAIGSIDVSGFIEWPSMPSWLGGGDAEPAPSENVPGKAAGGPIFRGSTYMVGERRPN